MRVDRSSGIWGSAVVRMTVCDSFNTMAGLVSEETVIKNQSKDCWNTAVPAKCRETRQTSASWILPVSEKICFHFF